MMAMSTEAHKALVRRWVDAWNTNTNLEVIAEIFAPDWQNHNPLPGDAEGIEGVTQFVLANRRAFSDIQLTIDLLLVEGDRVMFRWITSGTHTGEFAGIPPTGRAVTYSGITVHRVVNGKFAETVTEFDLHGLLQQLGAMSAT